MRLVVSSNFGVGDVGDMPEGATLRVLLNHMAKQHGYRLFTQDWRKVVDQVQITVNGKDHLFLPLRLETPLKEGDEIRIYFYPLGGG